MQPVLLKACTLLIIACAWALAAAEEPPVAENEVRAALESAAVLLRLGQPEDALAQLTKVEESEPLNPWLWFYRGQAHQQLDAPYKAMEAYDQALEILLGLGDPDPELAEVLRTLRRAARRQVLDISFQTGLAYDTNVSFLGSVAGTQDFISNVPDGKFASALRLHFSPIANATDKLTIGARLAHSWHFSVEQFNFQDYGATVHYERKLGGGWRAGLRYDYDFSLLGNDSFLCNHALTPSIRFDWPSRTGRFRLGTSRLLYRFESQNFLFATDPEFDRDGVVHTFGIEQSFRWQPIRDWDWWWDWYLGYYFEDVRTEGTEFDRNAHNYYLGVGVPGINPFEPDQFLIIPDKELLFQFSATFQDAHYRNPSLLDLEERRRRDFTTILTFAASQVLASDVDTGDLILHAIVSWTNADSNLRQEDKSAPFEFDKVIYGLQLEWSW